LNAGITPFTLIAGIFAASIIFVPFLLLFFQRDSSDGAYDSTERPDSLEDARR
jgi:hypothetical protein